ncbi:conserved hypothetical protein [Leishmania mexicana MHOM/GT/2001/U1103]|uniref:Uncharacterized protein n=1 Tax=Leishmania mexicana (strain MHOM/GT/2001/U1103) TaxID=929439 RepID=E9B1X4_LEIMU|nr:conserved hypothetical protein [Leishmania mexicana MHOM/GT/2001/U1103]CBZ29231.1 conserved hypothetical protein [Leishmania mexicana MHOM/GT/2001/U1103]
MRATSLRARGSSGQHSHPRLFPATLRLLPCRPSAPYPAVRAVRVSSITQQACMPLLSLHRQLSSDDGCLLPPTTPAAAATVGSATCEGDDDDLKMDIYRPQLTPEDAERKAKTDLFLCLVLTLPRDQDWKDMLTAAFRAGTWKPHHLSAVLRGVQLNKYNEPAVCALSCAGICATSLPSSRTAALRHSIVEIAKTPPASSTPSTRLQRARDILVFCAEEGGVYAPPSAEDPLVDVSTAPSSPADEETSRRSNSFAPSPTDAHQLLVHLLKAAQRGATVTPSLSKSNTPTQAVASFQDVWNFLAWMELHGYHILSNALLDALEAVVDEGGSQAGAEATAGLTRAAGASSASSPLPLQYAMVSQRVHRLDYLRGERALLQEAMKNAEQGSDGASMSTGAVRERQRRRRDVPRTAPVHTE